jgi:N-acetylmuramoyl-L-alanine amidase
MLFILILFCSYQPPAAVSFGVKTVVIDAGHGGHDPGCLGRRTKEKDVTLGIALKLGRYIEQHFSDVKVVYTRKKDEFVELYERADIANNAKADLFICIHCNSACTFDKVKKKEICSTEIDGVESWVMGLHKSEANLEVAKRENEVILLEKDYSRQYNGFDPNSPAANIIFSLYQNTYLDQSLRMATYVQQEVEAKGRIARGVKQAGFMVLYKTSMPSVLIETGFLSNPAEEKYLASEKGQDVLASSIYRAFRLYKYSVENSLPESNDGIADTVKRRPTVLQEKNGVLKDSIVKGQDSISEKSPIVKENNNGVKNSNSPVPGEEDELFWSVQFYTSPQSLPATHKVYRSFENVREDFENGLYKYSAGKTKDKNEALRLQVKIRGSGYKDAFVIAYYNQKKISIKEANEIMKRKIN